MAKRIVVFVVWLQEFAQLNNLLKTLCKKYENFEYGGYCFFVDIY